MKYISELQGIDKVGKNFFYHILKWKHPSIWQLFWCDGKLPFDDYELYLPRSLQITDYIYLYTTPNIKLPPMSTHVAKNSARHLLDNLQ